MTDALPFDRLASLSIPHRQKEIRAKALSLSDAAADVGRRIRERTELNAFITPTPGLGSEQGAQAEDLLRAGAALPLAGVLLAVKDNIALKDVPLTCASRILEGYVSLYTATALQRAIDAGAVVVGKTNLDEFAMGSSTEHSAFGPTLNPFGRGRVPGGSSGGSAAAVAAGLCTAALGSETGGSVRQPAAFCGLVGLKPTYGRVSRYGLTAFGSSLDQIGVIAKTADECARVFEVMAGRDPLDNTTSPSTVSDCSGEIGRSLEGLRVGVPQEYLGAGVQPAIQDAVKKAAELLVKLGATVAQCSLPHTRYAVPTYYIIAPAEASSNLARFDGVRYGLRVALPPDDSRGGLKWGSLVDQNASDDDTNPPLPPPSIEGGEGAAHSIEGGEREDIIRLSRQAGFGAEVKRRILLGTYVLSAGYYDAYYIKAQKVRRLIRDDFIRVFRDFDLLLTPTTPTTAFRLGEKAADPLAMYLSDIFTVSANLAGIPAIAVPFGADEKGLPIGVQLMAADSREDLLLAAAARIEEAR